VDKLQWYIQNGDTVNIFLGSLTLFSHL
jgi:hypothetical protein